MNLFKKAEQVKTSSSVLSLSTDENKWTKEIISEFLSQYPVLQNSPINLTWKKKSANKGYGVGSITILGGAVPVIVKGFQVSPFDVIVFPGRVLPLDEYTITEMTETNNPFLGAAEAGSKDSLSLFGDKELQITPNDSLSNSNQSSFERPAIKIASFLDRINSFDSADIKLLFSDLNEYEQNKIEEKIDLNKIASKAVDYENRWMEAISSLTCDRQYVYEDEDGNKFVKQANSKIDHVYEVLLETTDIITNKYADNVIVKEANPGVEFIAFDEIKSGMVGQFIDSEGNKTDKLMIIGTEKIAKLSDYVLLPVDNSNKTLILADNGYYTFIDKKINKARNIQSLFNFINSKPEVDSTGVWVVNGVATEDFTITKIIPDLSMPGNFSIIGNKHGFAVKYSLIPTVMDSVKLKDGKVAEYWVPGNAVFVKLTSKTNLTDSEVNDILTKYDEDAYFKLSALKNLEPVSYVFKECDKITNDVIPIDSYFGIEKEATIKIVEDTHLVRKDSAGLYHLFGPEFNKYASNNHKINSLNRDEAVWSLIHLGAPEDKIEEVINMYPGDEIKVANITAPITMEQFKESVQQVIDANAVEGHTLPKLKDVIKLAASTEDPITVDAILSLGLMNKFNVMEYIELIPEYEKLVSELARLLLFSRLTALNVKSQTVEQSVSSLNEIVFGLKRLREVLSYNKTTMPSTL